MAGRVLSGRFLLRMVSKKYARQERDAISWDLQGKKFLKFRTYLKIHKDYQKKRPKCPLWASFYQRESQKNSGVYL